MTQVTIQSQDGKSFGAYFVAAADANAPGIVLIQEIFGVNAAMKAAASPSYGYTEDEIVSSDIIGQTVGSLFDATQTRVNLLEDGKTLVKVVAWYDNENSYTSQMVRTIKYMAKLK